MEIRWAQALNRRDREKLVGQGIRLDVPRYRTVGQSELEAPRELSRIKPLGAPEVGNFFVVSPQHK